MLTAIKQPTHLTKLVHLIKKSWEKETFFVIKKKL